MVSFVDVAFVDLIRWHFLGPKDSPFDTEILTLLPKKLHLLEYISAVT
jgi:hypothetical protein